MYDKVKHLEILHSAHKVYLCVLLGYEENSDYFLTRNSVVVFFITAMKCLLRGTTWIFTGVLISPLPDQEGNGSPGTLNPEETGLPGLPMS
jgi:hypothetical protein